MGLKDLYLIGYNAACAAGWAYVLYLATCVVFASGVPCCHHEVLDALETIYNEPPLLRETLIVVQCAALLEIVHAGIGLVRSPVVVTGESEHIYTSYTSRRYSSDDQHLDQPPRSTPTSNPRSSPRSSHLLRTHSPSHPPTFNPAMQVMSRIVALFAVVYSPIAQAHYGSGLMIFGWSLVEVPRYLFYLAALITGDATKGTPYPIFYLRYSLFYVLYPLGITGEVRKGRRTRTRMRSDSR